jgi:hypothetical protein
MKMILLGAFFLTLYLTVFLLFNLRQDSFTIVQNRLKQLQISLIEQYYDRKNDIDWGHWSRELEQRREEIRGELKQGIKTGKNKTGKDEKSDIDVLIDKSWDELLNVMAGRRDKAALIDEEKLQSILNRVLSAGASIPAPAVPAANVPAPPVRAETPAEEVEELADAEPVEDAEELSDAEPVEDLEELSDAEAVEAVEDLEELSDAEAAEPIEDLEELSDAEAAAPVEELEELSDAGPVEAVEEIEEFPAVPELTEIGDMELTGAEIDKVMAAQDEGEPMELEELDELDEAGTGETKKAGEPEELEELEELEEPDQSAGDASPPVSPEMNTMDLANLASQIEFSSGPPKEEEEEDTALEKELEIVSPFATMLSDFSDDREADAGIEAEPSFPKTDENSSRPEASGGAAEGEKKKPGEEEEEKVAAVKRSESGLETLRVQQGMSLMYTPFLYPVFSDPQDLESLPDDPEEKPETSPPGEDEDANTGDSNIIEEHEGVHYINRDILNPGSKTEEDLNPDFKDLVDSVIK